MFFRYRTILSQTEPEPVQFFAASRLQSPSFGQSVSIHTSTKENTASVASFAVFLFPYRYLLGVVSSIFCLLTCYSTFISLIDCLPRSSPTLKHVQKNEESNGSCHLVDLICFYIPSIFSMNGFYDFCLLHVYR